MGQLFHSIRRLVYENRYVIGEHASDRLEERGIMEWQAVTGLEDGELIVERPGAMWHGCDREERSMQPLKQRDQAGLGSDCTRINNEGLKA